MPPKVAVRRRRAAALVGAAAVLLAACGVKGDLDPPPDADPATVRNPKIDLPPPEDGTPPSRPFVLDGLLR